MDLHMHSPAFRHGDRVPREYTCQGGNISPEIHWSDVPSGTKSMVLIMDDPDIPLPGFLIPSWTHWIVYDIDPEVTMLPEGVPHGEFTGSGARQGISSYKKFGYKGPCPPFGTHRYYFRIYALDKIAGVAPNRATRRRIFKFMQGHILARGELMGIYTKGG